MTYICGVVNGRNDPRESETEKHVDGVGSGDVSDGVVRMALGDGGRLGGEGVRKRRAQSDKRDG